MSGTAVPAKATLLPPRRYQSAARVKGTEAPAASRRPAGPKPGRSMATAQAIRKLSMPIGSPSGPACVRGVTAGQRAVVVRVGTPAQGAAQPQLS